MTTKKLIESASLSKSGSKFRIRLMSEGVGSSATYPADVLERDGALAFPKGTQIFLDHLTESDEWERSGNHSIKDLVGVTLTDAQYDATDKSLNADTKFYSHAAPFISEAMEDIGLSIESAAIVQEGVVEALVPSPLNAIAVVPRAGRDGKITQLIESYREKQNEPNSDKLNTSTVTEGADTGNRKDKGMTPEEIEKVAEALAKAIAPAFDSLKEALKPAPAPDADKETEALKPAEVAEALVAADLPESARKRVYAAIEASEGKPDLAALIEAEKTYIKDIKESLVVEDEGTLGRVRESAGNKSSDSYEIAGW